MYVLLVFFATYGFSQVPVNVHTYQTQEEYKKYGDLMKQAEIDGMRVEGVK